MSDLVGRLRAANTWLNEGDCCGQLDASGTCMAPACIFGEALKMAQEAAARIEQLEAEGDKSRARGDRMRMALEDIAYGDPLHNEDDLMRIARAALEEGK